MLTASLRASRRAANLTLCALTGITAIAAGYLGVITVAAAWPTRPKPRHRVPSTRFAVLVAAHNEQSVINQTLASVAALDYEKRLFAVHVVADNCSDRTAQIVAAAGFCVHERDQPDRPGKGAALNWLFDRLDSSRDEFDVAVVLDADSIVAPDFLRALDQAFADGAVAAQGFYSVRDPEQADAVGLRYVALASRHFVRPLGRCRLGASAGLYGNGMAFDWSVLRRHRWTGHLIEDAELQMELLLRDGILVRFVPRARLEAEMPRTLDRAETQNLRWERGRIDLATHYVPRLLRTLVSDAATRRRALADAVFDQLVPPLSVLTTVQTLNVLTGLTGVAIGGKWARRRLCFDLTSSALIVAHVFYSMRSVETPRSVYRSLLHAPRMIIWKVRLVADAMDPRRTVAWERTRRNSEVEVTER